jgi:TRAP-type C4-dicarboxylate transport system substrate-binding protein
MFKKASLMIIIVMVLSMFLVADVFAGKITLTIAESDPPTSLVGVYVNAVKDEIEKRTEGEVEVEVYWAESLLVSREILQGVKDGVVDIGKINPNNYPDRLFVNGVFSIFPQGPIEFQNIYDTIISAHEEIPAFSEELKNQGQKILGLRVLLPTSICSTKPFTSFEDFKGKKIRASSRWWLGFLEGAGAIPVNIPFGDCYMALETGNIDAVYTNIDGFYRMKMHEPAPNIFLTRELWTPIPMIYTMNINKWNSLPEDIQKDIEESFEAATKIFSEAYNSEWERIVSEYENGEQIVTEASEEDIQKWVSMPVIDELQGQWASEAADRGVENPQKIVDKIKDLIQEAVNKEK